MRYRFPFSNQGDEDVEINMTPMLDVVFILLIFFIVTTSFIRESGVEVNRPQAASASGLSQKAVLVAITSDNQVWIDRHPVDLRAVRRSIERLLADSPQSTIIVQADQSAQTGVLVSVLDQAKMAGASKIAVATNSIRRE